MPLNYKNLQHFILFINKLKNKIKKEKKTININIFSSKINYRDCIHHKTDLNKMFS